MKKSFFTISMLFFGLLVFPNWCYLYSQTGVWEQGTGEKLPDFLLNGERVYDKENYHYVHSQKKHAVLLKDNIPLIKRNYDVLRYDLYMDWYNTLNESRNDCNTISAIIGGW